MENQADKIYIALVDTPGIFAYFIRRVTGLSYVHVVLSLDERLDEAYSIGRRNPFVPLFAGFEREDTGKILQAFPTARYLVYSIGCTKEQKSGLEEQLRECYRKRSSYHYCVLGLPFIIVQKQFYQKNHYTCSSFIARCLEEQGLPLFDKHFSLVTPRDFYELKGNGKAILFEGELKNFACGQKTRFRGGALYEG